MGHLKPQPDDPLQHSAEGSLIWQFDAKSRYALAHDDLAVVKFCA